MAYAFWLRQWLQLMPISTDGLWPIGAGRATVLSVWSVTASCRTTIRCRLY